mgnify:CR=1 FL=1
MKNILKKNTITIMAILLIIVISIFLIFKYTNKEILEVDTNNYSFKYDNTWKITKKSENEVQLVHKKSNSDLNIKINELENEIQYKSLDEIYDTVLYNIQEQNPKYKLINTEKSKFTKASIDGYKLLFETDENQVAIYLYKYENKVVLFSYESTAIYFDIVLDSVNNIIYNFNVKEHKFDIITTINLETEKINYNEQEDIVKLLNDKKEDEIVSSNYLVQYTIPSNFESIEYNTQSGIYTFANLPVETSIDLKTDILKCNIYEYLDKNNTQNVYNNYNLNTYNKENELIDKFEEKPLSYIYKNSYLTNNKLKENIEIIFELNNSTILVVKISSNGIGIPEELVRMIKINKIQNVASNIRINKEDGYITGNLKRFTDYTYKKTEEIIFKLPEKYVEIDKGTNLYVERNYGLNYNEVEEFYEYELKYKTISSSIESELEILDKSIIKDYGKYKDFNNGKETTINNKHCTIYERGYTMISNITNQEYYVNENVIFYDLENNHYLVLTIKGNGKEISNEIIKQLINFNINIE